MTENSELIVLNARTEDPRRQLVVSRHHASGFRTVGSLLHNPFMFGGGLFGGMQLVDSSISTRARNENRRSRLTGFMRKALGDVTKAAGLTHGAFYAHFASKKELQAAAVAYGQKISLGRVQAKQGEEDQRVVCRPVSELVAPG